MYKKLTADFNEGLNCWLGQAKVGFLILFFYMQLPRDSKNAINQSDQWSLWVWQRKLLKGLISVLLLSVPTEGDNQGAMPFFRRPISPKAHKSEGPLVRRPISPKVHYSEGPWKHIQRFNLHIQNIRILSVTSPIYPLTKEHSLIMNSHVIKEKVVVTRLI